MWTLMSRLVVSGAILASLALGAAAPVLAAPAPDYGASVKCRYVITEGGGTIGWTEARLNKLAVSPPTVFAQHGTQQVGWRYVVQRSLNWDQGPWKVTNVSPVQRASATTSSAAPFSKMTVGVSVPNVDNQAHVYYLVTLKVFWYASAGSIESKASYEFDSYTQQIGHKDSNQDSACPGLVTQAT